MLCGRCGLCVMCVTLLPQVDDITQVTADTALTPEGENKCKSNIGRKNELLRHLLHGDERHCGTCSIYPASFCRSLKVTLTQWPLLLQQVRDDV